MRLTRLAVERMQPTAQRREVPDNVVSGLYFIVQPSGVKSWAVRYRFDRKPCKLTLGRYPAVDFILVGSPGLAVIYSSRCDFLRSRSFPGSRRHRLIFLCFSFGSALSADGQ
jgi:hypothetical protein